MTRARSEAPTKRAPLAPGLWAAARMADVIAASYKRQSVDDTQVWAISMELAFAAKALRLFATEMRREAARARKEERRGK